MATSATVEIPGMSHLSHSKRLRDKIRLVRAPLDQVAEKLWTHPRLREIYPEFLFLNHSVIRCSVPLMKAGAEQCEKMLDREPIAAGMLAYLQIGRAHV